MSKLQESIDASKEIKAVIDRTKLYAEVTSCIYIGCNRYSSLKLSTELQKDIRHALNKEVDRLEGIRKPIADKLAILESLL